MGRSGTALGLSYAEEPAATENCVVQGCCNCERLYQIVRCVHPLFIIPSNVVYLSQLLKELEVVAAYAFIIIIIIEIF